MTEPPVHARLTTWKKNGKAFIAALWAVGTVIVPLWSGDHAFDLNEKLVAVTAVGAAVLTYVVPAVPSFRGLKSVVNALMAGIAVVQTVISNNGDFSGDPNAWLLVIAAVLGALGVKLAPAASVNQQEPVVNPTGFND